ncbi:MAG: hypothetical protein AVDCRST_MAG93-9765, partial [uncultured Chloroflexia bacterium]
DSYLYHVSYSGDKPVCVLREAPLRRAHHYRPAIDHCPPARDDGCLDGSTCPPHARRDPAQRAGSGRLLHAMPRTCCQSAPGRAAQVSRRAVSRHPRAGGISRSPPVPRL